MSKEQNGEMKFWTKDEYMKFSEAVMDKEVSYIAFEILYWCSIRLGELLALTPADFNFKTDTLSITKFIVLYRCLLNWDLHHLQLQKE